MLKYMPIYRNRLPDACFKEEMQLRRKLATLDPHRLRDDGSFRNRHFGNGIGHRGQQQRNLAMAHHFAELTQGGEQARADPALDLIAGSPAPLIAFDGKFPNPTKAGG